MTLTRRTLLLGAAAGLAAASLGVRAQGVKRIGHLSGSARAVNLPLLEAFKQGLAALGWQEKRDYVLEERYAEGKFERLPALVADLLAQKPDLLLVATTPANVAVKKAKTGVPVVFVLVADPIGAGLVPRLARQGVNVTGVTPMVAELAGKRLQILKEMVPKATRFAAIVNTGSENAPLQMRYAHEGAKAIGVRLDPVLAVKSAADLETAFADAAAAGVDGAIRMIDPLIFMLRPRTSELAIAHRLPVIYPLREDVEAGGLVSYGTNVAGQFRKAAQVVDKILKGTSASSIPVEQPEKFDLVINLKTARAMGLAVPQAMLLRADEVIE